MRPTIQRLDDATINQIAAGEVVENGASIIKELIENSLDARATSIVVEIKAGGRQLIRVSDNGVGMGEEDALLAFERHATSKLRKIDDLENLDTMGFRGEALAAIGSISKVRLMTRPKKNHREDHREDSLGTLLEVNGGALLTSSKVPCDPGTTFEVKELFYNAPARKKFLKSPTQEIQEIQKTLIAISLGYPEVDFSLISDGTYLLQTLPQQESSFNKKLAARASEVLHQEVKEALQAIEYSEGGLSLKGLISPPTLHRQNRSGQYLFVNRRFVHSWAVSKAASEGYGSALPERRFPVFILHLDLPASDVDVNVHPQKKEVRFRQEALLKKMIRSAISRTWGILSPSTESFPKMEFKTASYFPPTLPLRTFKEEATQILLSSLETKQVPHILGIKAHYLLLEESPAKRETVPGLCLVDCKRGKERIAYESLLSSFTQKEMPSQGLLIPIEWHVSPPKSELIETHLAKMKALGFLLRRFTKTTWLIEAMPVGMGEEAKALLEHFLENEELFADIEEDVEKRQKFALLAATRFKNALERIEISEGALLLRQLLTCQQPYFSPTGQPIFAWIPLEELARYFK